MKEAFVLIGPIAAGKSYIGKLIENSFGVKFFEYEDIFIKESKRNPDGYLARAEPIAEREIFEFLEKKKRICFENTMSRKYALDILKKLQEMADVRTIYVSVPFDLALERFRKRGHENNIKWTDEEFRKIYTESENLGLNYDLIINNSGESDEKLVQTLNPLMEERKWFDDHVEINFRGQLLKFSSWSGKNLTPYDMEYKPWREGFRKENIGYLKNYEFRQGDIVVDAGAYEGTFTIYAAKAVGSSGKVIAFEPDTENCRKLKENIELNQLDNVTVINKALWCEDKKLYFNNKHTAGASFFFNASPHKKEIEAICLDRELKRLGIKKIDFIKMDVEGSEIEAIKGCKNTLKENDVKLAVSSYHIINGEETCKAVEGELNKLGYAAETDFPEHKTTYGFKMEA